MYSNPILKCFFKDFGLTQKFLAATLLIFIAFALLLGWLTYLYNYQLNIINKQEASALYHAALRRVLEGIYLDSNDPESNTHVFTQDAFNKLLDIDQTWGATLGVDQESLSARRPGTETPLTLSTRWKQSLAIPDPKAKNKALKAIQIEIITIMRYITGSIIPLDDLSVYYNHLQWIQDPQLSADRAHKLLMELNRDLIAAGQPPLITPQFPEKWNLTSKEGITTAFQIWEQLSAQEIQLLQEHVANLLYNQRMHLGEMLLVSLIVFLIGMLILWHITEPLRRMGEIHRNYLAGDTTALFDESFKDEVGNFGAIFNQMSRTVVKVVNQFDETTGVLKIAAKDVLKMAKKKEEVVLEQERITKQIAVIALEIFETSKDLVETVSEINQAAEATSLLAQTGRNNLQQLEAIMQGLVGAANHLVASLTDLNERTRAITTIISTMLHVADETNMLSLNASLEAAKAQQVGKGFAIIADEIRRLADQTAAATLNIEQVVIEILEMMNHTVEEVQRISDEILNSVDRASQIQRHFTEIIDKVQYFSGKFNSVMVAMRTQFKSARAIEGAIQLLKLTSQDSTSTIRQIRSALEEFSTTVEQFKSTKDEAVAIFPK